MAEWISFRVYPCYCILVPHLDIWTGLHQENCPSDRVHLQRDTALFHLDIIGQLLSRVLLRAYRFLNLL